MPRSTLDINIYLPAEENTLEQLFDIAKDGAVAKYPILRFLLKCVIDFVGIFARRTSQNRVSQQRQELQLNTDQKDIIKIKHQPNLFVNQWICFSFEGYDILDVFFTSPDLFSQLYANSEIK